MDKIINSISDILEVEDLDVTKKFTDYEEWDSLSCLSVLALLDSEYHITMTAKELRSYPSIEAFCKDILSK
jgi:acyl carrier protein